MNLKIDIHNKIVKIILADQNRIVDNLEFAENNDLSEKLLPNIAELLEKNKLLPKDIEKAQLETDLNDSFTTFRIAKTVVDTFNWAKGI